MISVVVPVYNSQQSLPELVERLGAVGDGSGLVGEVILVNDGSADGSWDTVRELSSRHSHVRGIDLMRNYGQHSALLCGVRAARYPIIVTIDDDLQQPPEAIPQLLERLGEGLDVVYGTPERSPQDPWRAVGSRVVRWALGTVMGAEAASHASAFRAFRTELRDAFAQYRYPFVSLDVLLSWGSTRIGHVVVPHARRRYGRSNYNFAKLLHHAISMTTGFSDWPLRLASVVGFGFTLFGLSVLAYVLVRYIIEGGSVPGFPFLASIIAVFSGAQLFALGVIGEYLGRVHVRSMDRPVYAVREDTARRQGSDRWE